MNRWLRLVRAPAALTAFGDSLVGAAAAGQSLRGRQLLLPVASVLLYWSGMALNDWADRRLDERERPERPIPSGEIPPNQALLAAVALTAAGVTAAGIGGGRRAINVAVSLAGLIWAYDLVLKSTPVGPFAMAGCRGLDVLLGSTDSVPAAAMIACHTLGVTALSAGEVHGGDRRIAAGALALTTTTAVAAAVTSPLGAAGYLAMVGGVQAAALRDPSAMTVRTATADGIHGLIALQATLAAKSPVSAGLLALALPLARTLGRKVSPT